MSAVRLLVAALAGVVGLVRARAVPAPSGDGAVRVAAPVEHHGPPVPRGMRVARAVLVGIGALLTGAAFGLIAAGVPAGQWIGIAVWLAGALVLHDAVLAPLLLVAMRLLRRADAVLPWRSIAVVEVVLVAAGVLTLLAFPALRAQAIGPRNSSVLPFDYGLHLAVAWGVAGALVVAAVVAGALLRARAQGRSSTPRGGSTLPR